MFRRKQQPTTALQPIPSPHGNWFLGIPDNGKPLPKLNLPEDGLGWSFDPADLDTTGATTRAQQIARLRQSFKELFGEEPPF